MKEALSRRDVVCRAEVVEELGAAGYCSGSTRSPWFPLSLTAVVVIGVVFLWWFDPAKTHLPMCGFYAVTGLQCPGCGATRATHELLHGRLTAAWHYNALWVASWPLVVFLLAYQLFWGRTSGRFPAGFQALQKPAWLALAAAAVAFFVARNYCPL